MKVHHLNCGNMLVHKREEALAVCHCLLVETAHGLVLVDTGIGTADMERMSRIGHMHLVLRIRRRMEDTALFRIRDLGFSEKDVKHIVITHLDSDHTGGIGDFPRARVHVFRPEYEAAAHPATYIERNRYSRAHLDPVREWAIHDRISPESWYGFDCIRGMEGLPEDIVLIPLPGHTRGHCGVAVREEGRWSLLAGDAYYHHLQVALNPGCPFYVKAFQKVAHMNPELAEGTRRRLQEIANTCRDEVTVFCSHDPGEMAGT